MTVEHSRPSVGTTATLIAQGIGTTEQVCVQNSSAVAVYLGGAGVTTASYGFQMDRLGSRDEFAQ